MYVDTYLLQLVLYVGIVGTIVSTCPAAATLDAAIPNTIVLYVVDKQEQLKVCRTSQPNKYLILYLQSWVSKVPRYFQVHKYSYIRYEHARLRTYVIQEYGTRISRYSYNIMMQRNFVQPPRAKEAETARARNVCFLPASTEVELCNFRTYLFIATQHVLSSFRVYFSFLFLYHR